MELRPLRGLARLRLEPRRPLQVDATSATIVVAAGLLASPYQFSLVVQIGGNGLAADRSPGSWQPGSSHELLIAWIIAVRPKDWFGAEFE